MSEAYTNSREIKRAFLEYDRKAILNNVIVGCLLGAVLMPVGTLLDYKVYNYEVTYFLKLRLLCSLLIIFFGGLVITPIGRKHPRKLGVLLGDMSRVFHFLDDLRNRGINFTLLRGSKFGYIGGWFRVTLDIHRKSCCRWRYYPDVCWRLHIS